MHAENIKLYRTAGICKLCHKLSDAQKSCINKSSALQRACIVLRYERLSEIQRSLDTNHLKTWRRKLLHGLQRNRNMILKSSAEATKSTKELTSPFSHIQTPPTRTTGLASSSYSVRGHRAHRIYCVQTQGRTSLAFLHSTFSD